MAVFAVSITKEVPWRGGTQEFSNVYHYATDPAETFPDEVIIDNLVDVERTVHTTDVAFVRGRTWGPTDQGQAASKMREIIDLSGTGDKIAAPDFYRELAFLCQWPLGRYGSRNRPQFLRKWIHSCTPFGLTGGERGGYETVETADLGELPDYINLVTNLEYAPAAVVELCTADGKEPVSPGTVYPYLEHRQLGR